MLRSDMEAAALPDFDAAMSYDLNWPLENDKIVCSSISQASTESSWTSWIDETGGDETTSMTEQSIDDFIDTATIEAQTPPVIPPDDNDEAIHNIETASSCEGHPSAPSQSIQQAAATIFAVVVVMSSPPMASADTAITTSLNDDSFSKSPSLCETGTSKDTPIDLTGDVSANPSKVWRKPLPNGKSYRFDPYPISDDGRPRLRWGLRETTDDAVDFEPSKPLQPTGIRVNGSGIYRWNNRSKRFQEGGKVLKLKEDFPLESLCIIARAAGTGMNYDLRGERGSAWTGTTLEGCLVRVPWNSVYKMMMDAELCLPQEVKSEVN
jgi:hypothetical protein